MSYSRSKSLPQSRTSPQEEETQVWELLLFLTGILGLILLIYLVATGLFYRPLLGAHPDWKRFVIRPGILWAAMGYLLLIFRTVLWFGYQPKPRSPFDQAPSLTVVIPAYNEGSMVEQTIYSVAAAQYPGDRLEIIVIDDGSRDDTWDYMQKAAQKHPGVVKTIRFPENRGKRAALAEAFRIATGEIVATIDSDSVIERDALLELTGPFRDPAIGAVAGKVVAYNRKKGFIPRMLHVRFILSFDFLRAVQSTYGSVYCCPGALSAYRTAVVRKVLDAWLNQKFLGEKCTYGEDRSMTNFIFSCGYNSAYQRTAVVHTIVPESYAKLCKMLLRWDRSYIKEEIRLLGLLKKRPYPARIISIIDVFITNLRFPISYLSLGLLVYFSIQNPLTLIYVLSMIGFISMLNVVYYLRIEKSWDFVYGIFYSYFALFALFWIFPYAMFTVRSRAWMTR